MELSITEILKYFFLGIITSIPQLVIAILCIYYIIKVGSKTDGILLTTGSIISLLCGISNTVGTTYISTLGADTYLTYIYVIQGFSFLGSILFVIGFFLLIKKTIKYFVQS
ncbi:hypothetical protein ATO12_14090 [Aquimarina atlantica]|uniref:MotA/TolQ/ExbB proton channel domain-containing protein n=1 Tax=Aquimarina atlantica TaxID=1317122 RepID=A0A023BVN0_9FLAO|nr:hypothetical protein [Aquimarina atlantica]EZH74004.1 hypothetical protein ATO12_14090 [Aquimarina atlantica]